MPVIHYFHSEDEMNEKNKQKTITLGKEEFFLGEVS